MIDTMTAQELENAHKQAINAHNAVTAANAAVKKAQANRVKAFRRFDGLGGNLAQLARELDISRALATRIKNGDR